MPMTQNQQKERPATDPNRFWGIVVIFVAIIAIVTALSISIMKMVDGGDETGESEVEQPNADDLESFQVKLWDEEKELSEYDLSMGTLISVPEDGAYTPDASSLKEIFGNHNGQFALANTSMKLNKYALPLLVEMTTALNADCAFEEHLTVNNAYASTGDYQTGLTIRFRAGDKNLSEATVTNDVNPAEWLAENAWKYGFIARYPAGSESTGKPNGVSDVYRYVGMVHAYYITSAEELEEGQPFAFEDYLAMVREKTAKKPLVVTVEDALNDADNGIYCVYYVAAANVNSAEIPEKAELVDVSGDHTGYIVTVKYEGGTGK